jgi:hypothetical protein
MRTLGTNHELLAEALANLHLAIRQLDGRLAVVKDVEAAWDHLRRVLDHLAEQGDLNSQTHKSVGMTVGPAVIAAVRARIQAGLLKRSRNVGAGEAGGK